MLNRGTGVQEAADGRATRWRGQRERRRAEFVEAAVHAITEHGPDVSIEVIADRAGVARTRIYRHFEGKADLEATISQHIIDSLALALGPVWQPEGSPRHMIDQALRKLLDWIAANVNLYRYVTRHEPGSRQRAGLKKMISEHVAGLFDRYLSAFKADSATAEPLAFGLVGLVDAVITQWQDNPDHYESGRLAEQLGGWAWAAIDQTLRDNGVHIDPDTPLPPPEQLTGEA